MKILTVIKVTLGIIMSFLIVIGVIFVIADGANSLVESVPFEEHYGECDIVYHEVGESNIILRVDDVQAQTWYKVQERMINDANEMDLTLVLGVIPKGFDKGEKIYNLVERNRCNHEIALHGYDHSLGEFTSISRELAYKKAKMGLEILNEAGFEITTFISPFNQISHDAERGIADLGIRYISAGFKTNEFDFDTSTYDWEYKQVVGHDMVLGDCERVLKKERLCIIMIHPQDFVDEFGNLDERGYLQYTMLLEGIKEMGVNVITFRDLGREDSVLLN